jgi:hypothetical protein
MFSYKEIAVFCVMARHNSTASCRRFEGTYCQYQYSETDVMHFLFNLLRIKGLYMFRALFAHPQEVLHKRHLVYCVYWYILEWNSNPGAAN